MADKSQEPVIKNFKLIRCLYLLGWEFDKGYGEGKAKGVVAQGGVGVVLWSLI